MSIDPNALKAAEAALSASCHPELGASYDLPAAIAAYLAAAPTAMQPENGLVDRLLAYRPCDLEWGDKVHHTICDEAAAFITCLKAEVERQGEQIERMEYSDGDAEHWRHLATRLEEDVARLTKEREEFETGLVDMHRELSAAEAQNKAMREALELSDQALCDWLNLYASDQCSPIRVAEAERRVHEKGTIAYIADVLHTIRATLSSIKDGAAK